MAVLLLAVMPVQAALELHDVQRYELDNGMTVLLLEDRNFPVVSVQMLYRVGARNEVTGKTGLVHFLEHMAFRATENFPDTGVVSRIYARGGEWHGYTWTDQTTYYATVPKDDLPLLLEIEADRMARLVLDPGSVDVERGAVLAELHMYENYPSSMLLDALLFTSFQAHPYRNNTIGWESDIDNVTHADVVDFYRRHYHPANAVLAVVGDFEEADVRKRIESLFGGFERRAPTPLPHTVEPPQQGERRVSVTGTSPGRRFMIGYRAPGVSHPDFAAFLVMQEILAGGSGVSFLQNDWGTPAREGSLLYGAASGVTSWFPPSAQDYMFVIGGRPHEAQDEHDVERAIELRVAELRENPPRAKTVARAIAAVQDELVFDVQTTEDAAHQIAFFAGIDALDVLLSLPQRLQQVTGGDVSRVAQAWLGPDRRTIAWYRQGAPRKTAPPREAGNAQPAAPDRGPVDEEPVAGPELRLLSNGLPAIVLASDLSPTLELRVIVRGRALSGDAFMPDSPEPGALSWRGVGRPDQLGELADDARRDLLTATHVMPTVASPSADPETRLQQAFGALMALPDVAKGAPAIPAVVIATGDMRPDAAFAVLDAAFGDFEPEPPPPLVPVDVPSGREQVSLGLPVAQSQLGYIVAAPAPTEPAYTAWRILQYIVAHGYEGRLGKEAISRRGLAYYIETRYSSAGGSGRITLSTGVDTTRLPALEALLAREFARLASAPPTEAEIAEARQFFFGRAQSASQSNEELAATLGRHWLRHAEIPNLDRLREQLDAVTRDDVLAVVPAFVDGLTIVVAP